MYRALGRSINLLLVEDNPSDSRLFEEGMREASAQYRLVVAETGQKAIDILFRVGPYHDAKRPDLILLDLNLPGLNGHDVLRAIKEDQSLRYIPVIVLTSSRATKDIMAAYAHGAKSYLQKSMDLGETLDLIRSIEHYWLNLSLLPAAFTPKVDVAVP